MSVQSQVSLRSNEMWQCYSLLPWGETCTALLYSILIVENGYFVWFGRRDLNLDGNLFKKQVKVSRMNQLDILVDSTNAETINSIKEEIF